MPTIATPMCNEAMNSVRIFKRWLGGSLSPDVYSLVVESGMFQPPETRHTMQEVTPPGGMAAKKSSDACWRGREG